GAWVTHQWIKKAVLLYFRTHDNALMPDVGGSTRQAIVTPWWDKVPLKFAGYDAGQFREGGFRAVPAATVRTGAFIGRNVVLMPSFVHIGAYVDEGAVGDTWGAVRVVRRDGEERPPLGRGGHRRRARAVAGQSNRHRGQLLHRRPFRDR